MLEQTIYGFSQRMVNFSAWLRIGLVRHGGWWARQTAMMMVTIGHGNNVEGHTKRAGTEQFTTISMKMKIRLLNEQTDGGFAHIYLGTDVVGLKEYWATTGKVYTRWFALCLPVILPAPSAFIIKSAIHFALLCITRIRICMYVGLDWNPSTGVLHSRTLRS